VETSVSTFFLALLSLCLFAFSLRKTAQQALKGSLRSRAGFVGRPMPEELQSHPRERRMPDWEARKKYLKLVAYFLAVSERLFSVHVYHAFHHDYTSKKPPLRRQIFQDTPQKHPQKYETPA
jgi:hypothetical protein